MKANIEPHIISKCGRRASNEDVEAYRMNLSTDGHRLNPAFAPGDFFTICDGHGGKEVASFIVPYLEKYLMKKDLVFPLEQKYISDVFDYLQNKLVNHPNDIASFCGCTALVAIFYLDQRKNRWVQVINIGDCRAIVSRDGLAVPLSIDHKPSWPDEKRRIDRVNIKHRTNKQVRYMDGDFRIGDLSVSRSFGDLDNTPHVTHIPDIYNHRLYKSDEFVVMACDGVWDVLRNEEVVNFVRDHRLNNHIELYNIRNIYPQNRHTNNKNIAEKLADYAIARGSTDNISIIIIFFK